MKDGLKIGGLTLLIVAIVAGTWFFFSDSFSGKSMENMNKSAVATITDARQTNVYLNNKPQVELTYAFTTEKGEKITVKEKLFFDYLNIGKIRTGLRIRIRYQEDKPENAALDNDANTK